MKVLKTSFLLATIPILILMLFGGCATTIPETDNTQPRVELLVSGPGIGTQRMSNPPKENWTDESGSQLFNLQPETRYNFTLTVSDQGGAATAYLHMLKQFEIIDISPDDVNITTNEIVHQLTLSGDREDPRTALVISGAFRTHDPSTDTGHETGGIAFEFMASGSDFGGQTGVARNERFLTVQVLIPY